MKFEYPELIWINHFLSLQLFSFLHVGEKVSDHSAFGGHSELLFQQKTFCSQSSGYRGEQEFRDWVI